MTGLDPTLRDALEHVIDPEESASTSWRSGSSTAPSSKTASRASS